MAPWLASLAALALPGQDAARVPETPLPTPLTVASAYNDYAPPGCPPSDECDWASRGISTWRIRNLHCRSTGKGKASCLFMVDLAQCEGRFAVRSMDGVVRWRVEWSDGEAARPRVHCRK